MCIAYAVLYVISEKNFPNIIETRSHDTGSFSALHCGNDYILVPEVSAEQQSYTHFTM